jgi:hypothetical protein
LNPKPGDGGYDGGSYSWDDPTSPDAVFQSVSGLSISAETKRSDLMRQGFIIEQQWNPWAEDWSEVGDGDVTVSAEVTGPTEVSGEPAAAEPQKRSDTSGDKEIKTPPVTEQSDPNRGSFERCYEGWRFSTVFSEPFRGTRFHGPAREVLGSLEILGPPVAAGDTAAMWAKSGGKTLGKPGSGASGVNWAVRRMATGPLRGSLTKVGNVVSLLRYPGAFTTGYNLSVGVQCTFGVIK